MSLGLAVAAQAADTAAVAAALPNEQAECRYLLQLCGDAQRASARMREDGIPASETLARGRESMARNMDAIQAARVIEAKRGKKPKCFSDPACDFIERANRYRQQGR